jgi:hypothetical protein
MMALTPMTIPRGALNRHEEDGYHPLDAGRNTLGPIADSPSFKEPVWNALTATTRILAILSTTSDAAGAADNSHSRCWIG